MPAEEILTSLRHLGRDASRLIFEDELTSIYNRRFLLHHFEHQVQWDAPDRQPIALLMMDLDRFKAINDGHGHLAGDQALIHVARILKEVAGPDGMPIRYAGDEFMVLLPGKRKPEARRLAERLLERCRTSPLVLEDGTTTLALTLSIGCASVPEDAQNGRTLIQRADAAMYRAKHLGRNRVADAAEVTPADAPQRTALQNLRNASLVGREPQLAAMTAAFDRFAEGRNQFVLIEGAAGMGKTTFLETLHEALAKKSYRLVRVSGVQQEGYRPYYLFIAVIRTLLAQHPDKAAWLTEYLGPKELGALHQVLPHLQEEAPAPAEEEEESTQREQIFSTLINVLPLLADVQPVVLLVDDMQFADVASLLLLRRILLRRELPLFVCGTSLSAVTPAADEPQTPLTRFYAEYRDELGLAQVRLTPLTREDVTNHLRRLFPQITVPDEFRESLLRVSQGNPLMLSEVIHKLVLDQKIMLVGQQWTLQPVEEGYLPKSLDEIITQKLSILDEESRRILAHASTLGEDVPVSMLTGSTEQMESRIEEFIERSAELGLISADFREDDEIIRFLGKRVLDITYGSIDATDRERLHERVGTYQEQLFKQNVLPSASYLAYHFKRSANWEKARRYEELQTCHNRKIFNPDEAVSYTGDFPGQDLPDLPLDPHSLSRIPHVIRTVLAAVRTVKLYPPESKTVVNANIQVMDAINQVLVRVPHVKIVQEENALLVNGDPVDVSEYKAFADNFLEFMRSVELGTIAFTKGLDAREMQAFLSAIAQIKPAETLDSHFWKRFGVKQGLGHVLLTQVRYAERGIRKDDSGPVAVPSALKLEEGGLALLHEVIRTLLSASKNIKIYPLNSRTVTASLESLLAGLTAFLEQRPSLTLARAGTSLLVNGDKVDTSEFKAVADGFLESLAAIGLHSLTFLRDVSREEIEAFMARFCEVPPSGATADFWRALNQDGACPHILFDEYLYGIELASAQPAPEEAEDPVEEDESFEAFVEGFAERVGASLLNGETDAVAPLVARLFRNYQEHDPALRGRILECCRAALTTAPMGFKQQLSKLLVDPLLEVCAAEREPKLGGTAAETLHRMAEELLPFADYPPATRIFSRLLGCLREFERARDPRSGAFAKVLERTLEPRTQSLLIEDLKSADSGRQQYAAQLVGSLGPGSLSMLIDVIKQEEDLRVRQLAAGLLAQLGPKAGERLKQALALEVSAQGRYHILEVIDTVTQSLQAELSFALGDDNRRIRKAAFQLAERVNDEEVWGVLMSHASSEDTTLATGAIKCLGKLQPPGAREKLVALLNATRDTERAVACCQALGQIGDTDSIEALARVAAAKGFLFFGRRWNAQVRAAAAFALRQMPRARVAQVLRPLTQDRDPRVRSIARSFVKGQEKG